MNLPELDNLLTGLKPYNTPPRICGIYFLADEQNEVIYVGQSRNIAVRIRQHRANKEFSTIHYIEVDAQYLNRFETWLIRACKPTLNRTNFIFPPIRSSRGSRAGYMRGYTKRPVICPHCGHTFTELKRAKA